MYVGSSLDRYSYLESMGVEDNGSPSIFPFPPCLVCLLRCVCLPIEIDTVMMMMVNDSPSDSTCERVITVCSSSGFHPHPAPTKNKIQISMAEERAIFKKKYIARFPYSGYVSTRLPRKRTQKIQVTETEMICRRGHRHSIQIILARANFIFW